MSVDFATYIANERARIAAGRRSLVEKIGALKNESAALDREEIAIKCYEAAKTGKAAHAAARIIRGRRGGRREEIIYAIRSDPQGLKRGELLENLGVKGDKSAEMSVSNALTALKKRGEIVRRLDGKYVAPELEQAAE
jgi:hypothetical protein